MNEDQPVIGYISASLNEAILHATVRTRDQVTRLCTPSGSIEDLNRPKENARRNQ